MTFESLVSRVDVDKEYLYRNRYGKPTSDTFRVLSKDAQKITFLTASSETHSLREQDWDEVVKNLLSLRNGGLKRHDLKTWRPSYAYAFIGHFESLGTVFIPQSE